MLIGNYSVFNKSPGRDFGGGVESSSRFSFNKPGSMRGFFYSNTSASPITRYASVPNGYDPPYSWVIAQKSGGMTSHNNIVSLGTITSASLAGGLNATTTGSTIGGFGTIQNVDMGLIMLAVAEMISSGSLTSDMTGQIYAVAEMSSSGSLVGSIAGFANIISGMLSEGTISASPLGLGSVEAGLVSFSTLSPENLAISIWNSLATSFNNAGTMGNKLNSAGGASDPWGVTLSNYDPGTAGNIILLIQKILRNKTVTDPSNGTITVYDDDGVAELLTANLFEDVAGTQAYRDKGADRRERLA